MSVSDLITPVIYVLFLTGLVLIFFESYELFFRRMRRKKLLSEDGKPDYTGRVMIYLDDMLGAIYPEGKFTASKLVIISVLIFLAALICLFPTLLIKAVLPAAFFAAVPFVFLRLRLEKVRNRGSREAEQLVTGLLNFYRINHKNIFSAMEEFIKNESEGCRITRSLVFQLLVSLRNTRNAESIKAATERFAFGIKTNWAYMLSQCIYAAAAEGLDISESLTDILEQLKTARTLEEEKKRSNSESSRMVTFLVPFSFVATAFIGVFMMDIPVKKLLYNQFLDPAGIVLLMAIVGLFMVNILLLDAAKNGRFDY